MASCRAGLLQPLQAELSNTADVLSCSVALELVEELAQGGPGPARALSQALSTDLAPLLAAQDTFLRCQAIRVRELPLLQLRLLTVVIFAEVSHDDGN